MTKPTDPDLLAQGCAEKMWDGDFATQNLGFVIDEVSSGKSKVSVTVTKKMVNGHNNTHGGFIFFLADTAFAYACNSHNNHAVGQNCFVTFLRPSKIGDNLTASAVERELSGRSGIYDVTVTNQNDKKIAEFRGISRIVPGQYYPDPDEQN